LVPCTNQMQCLCSAKKKHMTSQPCAVAKHTVRTHYPWAEVLSYLQEHVGVLLHSQPIIFWHGRGWHMKAGTSHRQVAPRGTVGTSFYDVTFDDPKQAVAFALKWA
jgi:hypothetical protein